MTQCGSCTGEIVDGYLCAQCCGELKGLLLELVTGGTLTDPSGRERELTGLLEELENTAIGQSRLNDPVRHSRREPLTIGQQLGQKNADGEAHPLAVFPNDDEESIEKARAQRPLVLRRRLLAAGRVNEFASDLSTEIHRVLKFWVVGKGGLAVKHGRLLAPPPQWHRPANEYRYTTRDYALWLVQATHLISLEEDAGAFHRTLRQFVARIKKVIDRPELPRECGLCPTIIDLGRKGRRQCATRLVAPRSALEVTCESCQVTYRIDGLMQRLIKDSDDWVLTRSQILDVLDLLAELAGVERVPTRTFDDWRAKKKFTPRGWWRPTDPIGVWHEVRQGTSDRPAYRLADVRRVIDEKAEKAASA